MQKSTTQISRYAILGKVSAQIAHDMRSPLSVIKEYIRFIANNDRIDNPQFSSAAKRSIEKALFMVESMLDIARASSIAPKPIEIESFIQNITLPEVEYLAKNHHIVIHCKGLSNHLVQIDSHKLSRVLINIIHNSIKAIDHENGVISLNIVILGKDLMIEISDNGKGIEPKYMPHIFSDYFTTDSQYGTGLGLPFAKETIEAHNGKIRVISEVNRGTTVSIYIPDCVVELVLKKR
jgi:signal transduction histidine kinase